MGKSKGRLAYEAELKQEPNYRATGGRRPTWEELSRAAREAWEAKAKSDA